MVGGGPQCVHHALMIRPVLAKTVPRRAPDDMSAVNGAIGPGGAHRENLEPINSGSLSVRRF